MDNEQQAQLEAIIRREAHALVAKNNAIPSIKQLDAAVRAAPDYDPSLDNAPGFTGGQIPDDGIGVGGSVLELEPE